MSDQLKQTVFFGFLALMSYGLYRYFFSYEEALQDKPFTKGYSVENITLKITDEDGFLTAKFKSPSLIRYTDDPSIHILNPVFWTYKNGKMQWQINAEKALYNAEDEEVFLSDKLIAKTVDTQVATKFEAQNLKINLKTKKAQTTDGIKLEQESFKMSGKVALINMNTQQIEVNNNVKAIYKAQN